MAIAKYFKELHCTSRTHSASWRIWPYLFNFTFAICLNFPLYWPSLILFNYCLWYFASLVIYCSEDPRDLVSSSLESLKTAVFEPRTVTGIRIFSSLTCTHLIRGGGNEPKTITVTFQLPSVPQKRLCLNSLLTVRNYGCKSYGVNQSKLDTKACNRWRAREKSRDPNRLWIWLVKNTSCPLWLARTRRESFMMENAKPKDNVNKWHFHPQVTRRIHEFNFIVLMEVIFHFLFYFMTVNLAHTEQNSSPVPAVHGIAFPGIPQQRNRHRPLSVNMAVRDCSSSLSWLYPGLLYSSGRLVLRTFTLVFLFIELHTTKSWHKVILLSRVSF